MREAFSGQTGSDPYTIKMASQSGSQSESSRIQKLREAIEAIEHRIEERSANGISNAELNDMQKQLTALSRKVVTTPPHQQKAAPAPAPQPAPAPIPQVQMKAPQPVPAPQQVPHTSAPTPDFTALSLQQDQALEVISRQFDVLKAEIAALKNSKNDDDALGKITAEISDLRNRMKKDVRREIATSSNMSTRLNELSENVETLAVQSGNAITPRVDDLSRQIDSMRLTIEDLPQTLSITSMEKRLNTLVEKIDTLPETNESGDNDMAQVERRLDEIARGLVAVSNIGGKCDGKVMTRLEKRLAKLDETVATIAHARANQLENKQIEELADRIERLTGTLGSFEKYAENGDMGAASALFAGPDTSALEAQLAQLTARLDENTTDNSTAAQLSSLEAQMGKLMRQMNKSASVQAAVDFAPVEARLGQLETKIDSSSQFSLEAAQHAAQQAVSMLGANSDQGQAISALSSELASLQTLSEIGSNNNRSISEMQATLGQIVDRLGHIETSMSSANTASLMASTAAPMPRAPQYDPEPQMAAQAETTLHAAQSVVEETSTSSYEFAPVIPDNTQSVVAPSIDPTDDLDAGLGLDDDLPLEPSAVGNPDLNRMVEEATAKLDMAKASYDSSKASYPSKASYGSGADNIKPDPIGAARRALKATTDEMKVEHGKLNDAAEGLTDEEAKNSIFARLSGMDLRKPIIVAAAATLLFLAATFGYKKLVLDTDAKVAANQPTTIEQTVEPASETMSPKEAPVVSSESAAPATQEVPAQPTVTQAVASNGESDPQVTTEQTAAVPNAQPSVTPTEADNATLDTTATQQAASQSPSQKYTDVDASVGPDALVRAAQEGDSKALFELGMRYSDGKLIARDMAASAKWFERSAEAGYAPAQYSVGSLYEKGIGVEKNLNTAAAWYAKAADQGNARAMHNLAVISATGAEPDMDTAINWFKQAGEFGIKDSQFNLGILYGQGMGVPQNLGESYKWFAIAAKTGDADAAAKRDEVANSMDKADLAEAKAAVAAWKQAELNDATNKVVLPEEWRGKKQGAQNSIGILIKQAQVSLNERGFAVGEPDGLIGPKTKAAIMEFQRAAGLPITGIVDKGLMAALGIKA